MNDLSDLIKEHKNNIVNFIDGVEANAIKYGYNKAIDDFTNLLKDKCTSHYIDCDPYFGGWTENIVYEDDIEEFAEQLKKGYNNETN